MVLTGILFKEEAQAQATIMDDQSSWIVIN